MSYIDINCDMGESFGCYHLGRDEEILDYITSANIACGFHAGDPATMRRSVQLALQKGIGIGAHPGFQDLVGFGRREMHISPAEAYELIVYQIGALHAFVVSEGGKMQHVKPHGALYNMAANNALLAEAIAEAVYRVNPELILFGLSGSELVKAGQTIGLRTADEIFSDRTYRCDGTLTPRNQANALIKDPEVAVSQVISIIKNGKTKSIAGTEVTLKAKTVCIHGDGGSALDFAKTLKTSLTSESIIVKKINDTYTTRKLY
ncbi:LamB/YcsF family protein [Bacillus sp. AGMB 02131]|uniref:5-oxoprolinase subunit A n=1 Tax=Peribacillus faecalis TaxID=2772559 RepID=A0A927CXY0_9BACI|nr:5-oxoprolinase subunit PxpA [Peribacillus faecalis]MBD3109091.1 LamB/YcsF family protein [Peribacillus faecalis]